MQYLFQCKCPPVSEEWRFPQRIDVVVSGCQHAASVLSPSGRLLYVLEIDSSTDPEYLLNLDTNEKKILSLPQNDFYFLTDDLFYIFVHYEGDVYLVDYVTGERYSIPKFMHLYVKGYVNELPEALHNSKQIYLLNDGDVVVALLIDSPESSEQTFFISRSDIPGRDSDRVKQFLEENHITYRNVPLKFPGDVLSPNGKFEARTDGVYSAETGQLIIKGITSWRNNWQVMGWTYDGAAVIYSHNLNPCVFRAPGFDGTVCVLEVPQPVLKLKIPEEYLLPNVTP